ncbi:hypothetical protein GCM10007858_15150 [Bradyrhizobium liaoningense]|nr:hypothetical protein GCM10007858_15150 [Bradyrhizobium liaoningense]
MSGSGLRLVMSQPDAALYIHVPVLAMTVAIQTTLKALCRKAIHGEALTASWDSGFSVGGMLLN